MNNQTTDALSYQEVGKTQNTEKNEIQKKKLNKTLIKENNQKFLDILTIQCQF